MQDLRNVPEVDLGDIPTKPIDKEKEGFYLFVQGDARRCNGCKVIYYFPIIKKDLAMLVFCKLHKFDGTRYDYIAKEFLPRTELYELVSKITSISMFLCSEGKILEVAYDPNYKVNKPDTNFSSFDFRYR